MVVALLEVDDVRKKNPRDATSVTTNKDQGVPDQRWDLLLNWGYCPASLEGHKGRDSVKDRDADETVRDYGVYALDWAGEVMSTIDGVTILSDVVEEIEAVNIKDDKKASKAAWMGPLIKLYADSGRWGAVVLSSIGNGAAMESLILRVERASTGTLAKSLRSKLRADLSEQTQKTTIRLLGPDEEASRSVRKLVDWPEYPEGIVVPQTGREGWILTQGGLSKVRVTGAGSMETLVGPPILMTRKLKDVDTGIYSVTLAWRDDGEWVKLSVPRSSALDTRALVALCDRGIPLDSTTAKNVVEWIGGLDRQTSMPTDYSTIRMGWVGSGTKSYMLGEDLISPPNTSGKVSLVTNSVGSIQIAKAVTQKGTWEGWLSALELIGKYPSPWLAIYAAATAPLLRLLGAPNFALDFAGPSSSGKTTILELAASTYGIPRKGEGYRGWGGTLAGTEGAVGFYCDMPFLLDEGQLIAPAKRAEAGILLQTLIDGAGRPKGSLGRLGQSQVESWRSVLLSTSETGIRDWSAHEGVKARCLEISGRPLGQGQAKRAEDISSAIHQHYGHLYPRLIKLLVESDKGMKKELLASWSDRIDDLSKEGLPVFARRALRYVAAMDLAASLLHDHIGIPEPSMDVLGWAWDKIVKSYTGTDAATSALEVAWSWISANEHSFQGSKRPLYSSLPSSGWLGCWETNRVGVVPEKLSAVLRSAGYTDPESIYRAWVEREVAVGDRGGRTRLRMALGSGRVRLIVLIKQGER